ncbi:MAG: AMP-binding protein [Pseudomonadota bacterium]
MATSSPTAAAPAAAGARSSYDTVPKLLLRNAKTFANRPAMREKDLGIWQTWTWSQMHDEIRDLALGLQALGLKRGETVAIIGDNRPRLYWSFCAAQSIGAIPVPMYQDAVADEMVYVLEHAEAVFAIVENQEQADKVIAISERLPALRGIIYDDERGLDKYDQTRLHSFEKLQTAGRDLVAQDPSAEANWHAQIGRGQADDVSVMLYTSGTTGTPKGVMLTQWNIVRSSENGNAFDKFTEHDDMIAYLPMAWVGDHIFSYGQSYAAGMCVACPESPETIDADRREIAPTYFFAPPRVFEIMLTNIMVRMEDAGAIKRRLFHYFLKVAERTGEKLLDGQPVPFGDRVMHKIGDLMIYGPLRNRMGFTRLRVAYTAGEAIGPELFSFFRSLGINLKQLYGQTEASVYVTLQPDGEVHPETVGKPGPEVDIKIDDNGEVLFRSPGVFLMYYKNEDATQNTKTADGWVRSGDAGFIDEDGHLRIIDRAKDVGKLADGALFAPKYLENKLKFFPEIREAVALGDGRDYATVMVNIDLTSVASWAERNNVIYASYQELAAHPDVYAMIEKRIDEINQALAKEPRMAGSQFHRFLILHKELDADDGELTRTQKVRRSFIADRYAPLIKALYDGSTRCQIVTEVTYEDGRTGRIEGDVKIVDTKTYGDAAVHREAAE